MADLWKTLGYDQIAVEIAKGLSETADINVIQGPPGVGKSWLAKGVGAMWEAAGGGVVVAEGDSMRSEVSLYPFRIAMGDLSGGSESLAPAAATLARAGEVLLGTGGLLTSSVEALASLQARSQRERAVLLDKTEQDVLFRLSKLARKRPLLVIADNLHWWDSASLEFLSRLRDARIGEGFPFLAEMRVLAVETIEPYQSVAHPKARDALLLPQTTTSFALDPIPREGFEEVVLALGAPQRPSTETADLIYKFSGGHLVLAHRCAARLKEGDADGFLAAADAQDFVQKLLSERLRSLGMTGEEAVTMLQIAAVSGLTFRRDELVCAAGIDETETLRLLRYCRKEGLLELQYGIGRFVHDLYRQYFLDAIGEERLTIHETLGDCLRKLSPGDYESRCINAVEAECEEDAAAWAVQAALQRQREGLPWRDLSSVVLEAMEKGGLTRVAECFEVAIEHTKNFRTADALQALAELHHDLPRCLMAEADYLRAASLMTTRSEKDRTDAQALLESWSDYVEEEVELGLRLMQLRLYDMAMQIDKGPGLKLEGEIRQILRKRSNFDPAAKDVLYTLDRCAGIIHVPNRAIDMYRRSVEYFGPAEGQAVLRRPVEYYLCLVNFGANLLSNGCHEEACEIHHKIDDLVEGYEPGVFPRLDYPRINALLTEYRMGAADIAEVVSRQREIVAAHKVPNDPFHVENALACYLALAGANEEALPIFDRLLTQLSSRRDPEPSMVYLIRANRCAARFVSGEIDEAQAEWAALTPIALEIPYVTRPALIRRHELLAEVMSEGRSMAARDFDRCLLADEPPEFSPFWTHHGRGFRMPAIQWWR